jgi:ACT domain-containing protein
MVLKDVPGQLVRALEPISEYGGNIISIVHMREDLKGGRVPVHVTFEIEDSRKLNRVVEELEKRNIWVSKLGEAKKKEKITLVLTGHIVDTDLRDTIDRLNEIPGVMVADVSLSMPHPERESSARLDIEVSGLENAKVALERLGEIAREKDLFIIKSLWSTRV